MVMKTTYILIVLIFFTQTTLSNENDYEAKYQNRIRELIQNSDTKNRIILDRKITAVDSSFHAVAINRKIEYCGKSSLSEIKIEFDTKLYSLKMDYVRIRKQDGRILFADTTKTKIDRKFTNGMPGTKISKYYFFNEANIGDAVDIQYQLRLKQPYDPELFQIFSLLLVYNTVDFRHVEMQIAPNIEHYLHIDPEDTMVHDYLREETQHAIKYIWFLENPPRMWRGKTKEGPRITINAWKDWQDFAHRYLQLYDSTDETDPHILKKLSDSLAASARSKYEVVENIQHFVANDIYNTPSKYDLTSVFPKIIVKTLLKKIRDSKAKTKLAYHLLKEQQIETEFVFIHTKRWDKIKANIPRYAFNHIFLRVLLDKDTLYIDGTLSDHTDLISLPEEYCNRDIFVFGDKRYSIETIRPKIIRAICDEAYKIILSDDGMITLSLRGHIINSRFPEERINEAYFSMVKRLFISAQDKINVMRNVKKWNLEDTTFYEMNMTGKIDLIEMEDGYFAKLNIIRQPHYMFDPSDYGKFNIFETLSHQVKAEIEIPANWSCSFPQDFYYSDSLLQISAQYRRNKKKIFYQMNRIFFPSSQLKDGIYRQVYLILNKRS